MMRYVFVVQRLEPDTFDYKGSPVSKVTERVCCSSAPKAWKVALEMIKKFPPYLPKVEADYQYYLYQMASHFYSSLRVDHTTNNNTVFWEVSVSKEELL